ncbi:alpha/beta hydrolase [Lederbergia wuyishanensis]|uniref:Alpha-beta hydrolase superfamily lysophospholipase n=1 Tax=Lederbergia wuyishanensis TaxID=1347903 RepID=A0ABU0D6U6_9BACI|nr:alpha/beta hydrolase [Lederbergia wuyishanensis]MCJ8008779.1 alpha/beta hydrolase [Lederbergia wuyishanensis]MDQ0344100.1 alpha-beta hydrolase superfamily lysophospholipase [Lederbergia wuyishanensis]
MSTSINWLMMEDGVEIYIKKWVETDTKPVAILQLAHGMAEHIDRYEDFAEHLVQNGIFVYGNDHRGHGETGEKSGTIGFFAKENGFDRVVDDLFRINQSIRDEYPNIPIFLMGHSMGSFLVRRYIQQYSSSVLGVILSGTAGSPGFAGKLGKLIAKWEGSIKGTKAPSPFLDRLSFGSFNKGIENPKTTFDWLSRDKNEVEKYINDPRCGFVCSSGFFYDLFEGLEKIHNPNLNQSIPKDLPMLFFSGDKDPVGGNKVLQVIEQYKEIGLSNIESTFFKDGRHEMLNEINKHEVFLLVQKWIMTQLQIK